MNIQVLNQRLLDEGCNPGRFNIGPRGIVTDIDCLDQVDGVWQVFFTERGRDDPPFFTTTSEEEACEFYFKHIMSMRQDHMVGFFHKEENARALMENLEQHGLAPIQDKIPYGGWHDPRFRVFVIGKAIFKAREILSEIPVSDGDD